MDTHATGTLGPTRTEMELMRRNLRIAVRRQLGLPRDAALPARAEAMVQREALRILTPSGEHRPRRPQPLVEPGRRTQEEHIGLCAEALVRKGFSARRARQDAARFARDLPGWLDHMQRLVWEREREEGLPVFPAAVQLARQLRTLRESLDGLVWLPWPEGVERQRELRAALRHLQTVGAVGMWLPPGGPAVFPPSVNSRSRRANARRRLAAGFEQACGPVCRVELRSDAYWWEERL